MPDRPALRLERLLNRLAQAGVDFVVVGGIAMVAHGSGRSTFDLDICYATDPANLQRLGDVLVELDAKLRGVPEQVPFVPDAQTLRRTVILTLRTTDGDIDLLVEPEGSPRYPQLKERAIRAELDGITVRIASLNDLESMKRAVGRPKDLTDLQEIETIRRTAS
ncbi:MAG: hypothetical protein J2O48_08825 [Solirubrobacterales bacterium]|nr:hypothetical protein [Solirubrobacterales bacterium]